ncbi:RecQ family ATP-dependent DNA helicase [Halalkalibacillus halophilus]|uniref:RecQ family ATP-dependent DNA helicase n=1 Tax=Halalkalibacillus halophilus TaxID=392827 RepID=UPI0003F59E3C|nr:RecQ family ATP-dependent DNA helicase [Halalkalibacillus halophilus]
MMKTKEELEIDLYKYFGYKSFREGQYEIIQSVMNDKHTLATLPTGSGKSICYQLPALLSEGITVVVSPLISLMVDQVKLLKANGLKQVTALNSLMNPQQKKSVLDQLQNYKIIYCSPEMLQQEQIKTKFRACEISLLVVDEAHCISQWGHEFRPDYMKITNFHHDIGHPPILALSATATESIQNDIIKYLNVDMKKIIYPMDRQNITYAIEHTEDDLEKKERLLNLIENNEVPTMIYFSSKKVCEAVSRYIGETFPNKNVAFYHGGMESRERLLIQQQFMFDQLDIICCTSAFGMGVDKANIRLVIHYHLPSTIEAYIQESGRAGRNGDHALSVVLFAEGDEALPFRLIESELPDEQEINKFVNLQEELGIKDLQSEISETKFRFLEYHSTLLKQKSPISKGEQKELIIAQSNHRKKVKSQNLFNLLEWVHIDGCKRRSLYNGFQNDIRPAHFYCCDYCDFNIHKWKFKKPKQKVNQSINWEDKLKEMFLIGEE